MAHIVSILLFAFSCNMDNLVVGISFGIKKLHISFSRNLLLALFTTCGTILSMFFAEKLVNFIPAGLASVLGSGLIIAIGLAGIIKYLVNRRHGQAPEDSYTPVPGLSLKQILALGLALTLNNFGIGIGAVMTGLEIVPTAAVSFCVSLFLLWLGNTLASRCLSDIFRKYGEVIANLIIILLGIYELFV
ncbi:MAG: manganese efflux pump [Eubacteriaceae bacterium]|jgi:putative Mn2+ efflux pump MntP